MDDVVLSAPARWLSAFAIDPGGVSGWAWVCCELRGGAPINGALDAVQVARGLNEKMCFWGEVSGPENQQVQELVRILRLAHQRAASFAHARIQRATIIESFSLRERTQDSSLLAPVRIASKLDLWVEMEDGLSDGNMVTYQTPADKEVISDDRLKRWGLWIPGKKDARAALKHLLLFLRTCSR